MVNQPLGSRYVLHDLLGRGAMGQVFRGTVRGSGAAVAVKVLKPELVSDPEVVARFFQERSILTSISHPNVVRVVDLVVEGYTLAIVMELVQGPDLRRFLQARRTLPPAEAVQLVRQLLAGLAAVHAAGIVHRDVKPENMLLDATDGQARVRLTDFGVARLSYGASLTKLSSIIGTPEYMAPEVADHDSAAPSADLYSAGVVLYEMLSGRTPFAGGHPLAVLRRQVEQPPPPIPGIPAPLWAQLETLLAKEPESRPASAVQAADSLALLTKSLADIPPLPLMPQPAPGTWAPSRATTGGAAVPDTPRTIARHRHREAGADDGSPVPADSGTGHKRLGGPRWRPRSAVIALPASLVILAAVAGVTLVRSHHPDPVARAGYQTVSYTFAPQQYHNGLLIVRRWALSGKDGSLLTETVAASSATGKALHAPFEEAIPAEIAPTLRAVRFAPAPGQIVQADPVVEWNLKLPARGSVTVGYQAQVPSAGATKTRLQRWASALISLQHRLNLGAATIQLRSLTMSVQTLRLDTAATAQLTVSGVLSNGKAAPRSIVSAAAWNSADPAVAIVEPSGKVIGIGPGTTYVTAQIGAVQATAAVTVTSSQPALADGSVSGTTISSSGAGSAHAASKHAATASADPGSRASTGSGAGTPAAGSSTSASTKASVSTPTPAAAPAPAQAPAQAQAPATSSAPQYYVHHVYNTCANGACGLNLRSGPGYSNYPVTRVLVDGDAVDIVCQTTGQSVSGKDGSSSDVWDKTVQGDYAADFYIDTPGMTGSFSPPIPQC